MAEVACVRRGLGTNIPKLKSRASGFPRLVKPIPQHPIGQGLAALVLNQPYALDLRRTAGDAVDDLGKLASDLDCELLSRLVLLEVQRPVPDVGAGQLEHVGRPLAGQERQVHGVLQGVMPFLPNCLEFVVFHVAVTAGFLVAFDARTGVRGVGVAPGSRLIEDMGEQGALPVGADFGGLAAQVCSVC